MLDETLCRLRYDLKNIKPSAADIRCYNSLRSRACTIYASEGERQEAFTSALRQGGILPPEVHPQQIGSFMTDGALAATCRGETVVYYIHEIKNEVSSDGAEPYLEVCLYWLASVRKILDAKAATKGENWTNINFPAILVMHFGPYLAIAAATYTDVPIIEHLCCISLHVHSTNVAELEAGERAVAALRVAVQSLEVRCPTLHTQAQRGDFPFRNFYVDDADGHTTHHFTYVQSIGAKRVYRVRRDDDKLLCIKFSTRYSAEAHRRAHALKFAPALHAVNQVDDWIMIVMDDMCKEYTSTMYDLHNNEAKDIPVRCEPAVSLNEAGPMVEEKLRALHEAGFVHGDVLAVNVLVRNKSATPERALPDVLLVDFDWAGSVGEAVYPRNMNPEISRPEEAQSGEEIKTEHDIWMAKRLY
ncbi:hypothetical protein C8Q80DRAFT_1235011 [Daedaleopsis nitida]|nr:hypothetical protein C8Q80DRAFT_1235011 [Daedaleopsis nitida]